MVWRDHPAIEVARNTRKKILVVTALLGGVVHNSSSDNLVEVKLSQNACHTLRPYTTLGDEKRANDESKCDHRVSHRT